MFADQDEKIMCYICTYTHGGIFFTTSNVNVLFARLYVIFNEHFMELTVDGGRGSWPYIISLSQIFLLA